MGMDSSSSSSASQEKKGLFEMFKEKVVGVVKQVKKIGKDDPRRIIHSAKVGLALTFVSLFYYFRPLYDSFGQAGMWAVLTVVVVFEFTVGGTLSKSINRGFATLLAGALGVGAEYLAELSGKQGEPIMLGFFVFVLAAGSTFSRFFPHIKRKYDYGVLIFILTFSLVAVSGVRVDEIIELAHQRLSTIVIGGATCMIISIFICPVWAGQDLHNLITGNLEKLARFLEGFGDEYFNVREGGDDSKSDKSFLQAYKSVLNSKATEESLANFAWWEPCHGRFLFRHPWKQYLKVGVVARQCACHIEAFSSYINSKLQEPTEFRRIIQEPYMRMSSESGKALKELAHAMKNMTYPSAVEAHVRNAKTAVEDLTKVLESTSVEKANLMEIIPAVTVASMLIDIIKCVEKISDNIRELSSMAHFKNIPASREKQQPQLQQQQQQHHQQQLLHRGIVQPVNDTDGSDRVVIAIRGTSQDLPETDQKAQPREKPSQQVVEV